MDNDDWLNEPPQESEGSDMIWEPDASGTEPETADGDTSWGAETLPQGQSAGPAAQAEPQAAVDAAWYVPGEQVPQPMSRKPLVLLGLAVLVCIGGGIWYAVGPKESVAETKPPDFGKMSAAELGEIGCARSARELVRRMDEGTRAEAQEAQAVVRSSDNPRLKRNLCIAMALRQQQKAHQMNVQRERMMRDAHYGPRYAPDR